MQTDARTWLGRPPGAVPLARIAFTRAGTLAQSSRDLVRYANLLLERQASLDSAKTLDDVVLNFTCHWRSSVIRSTGAELETGSI
jgi:hypothetical protein